MLLMLIIFPMFEEWKKRLKIEQVCIFSKNIFIIKKLDRTKVTVLSHVIKPISQLNVSTE